MSTKKVLFVINKKAGLQSKVDIEKIISNAAKKLHFQFFIYKMNDGDVIAEIKNEIKIHQPDIVAAVGGDGTVNLIAQIIQQTDISLLIIPMGSANGMAKELQIPIQIKDCLALIVSGKETKIDLLKVNDEISIHLADVGLNARIVKRFQLDSKRGLLTYAKHLFFEVFVLKRTNFSIITNGKKRRVKAVSLTFANATQYGTGAVINPDGKLNDGLFEICIVKPFPKYELIKITFQMFRRTLKYSNFFEVIQCKEARVKSQRATLLQIDGEVIGQVKEINLACLPAALKVLIPNHLKHPTLIN
ncbi:MAG: NAD(+)/NADH kinase [Bacteroidetes bacterium]|nr:NAD(+)/NADH kinase [Bacteroidota bacterium]MBU1486220.1 NAD(+)/NADH kinase [Bacteroidota bacterium]MBU2045518.1 NAD(+)/NADH kinase [Bacteroidota bacterium]MBU2267493.1 NAD(+)/NADH kinase [Bacteroidota bacterium]MBU2375530.1 NAD(+)/NADH kinase [Bacteroidota bacterium]